MGGARGNLMSRVTGMAMVIEETRYKNQKKNRIQPKIDRSTCPVRDGACSLLIDLDQAFTRVILLMMQTSSNWEDVILVKDL